MDLNLLFGKVKKAPKKPKKLSKKILDSLSLKKLQKLAKKYKISINKKGSKKPVKKSTLLLRLKKSRSIKNILVTVQEMKKSKSKSKSKPKSKKTMYGSSDTLKAGYPSLRTPIEIRTGQTYDYLLKHYKNTPTSLISTNFPRNLEYQDRAFGTSSIPPYSRKLNKFGQYFH